jgi:lysophospholipid acyltransferase (LPLAT)-like uncharacterized protein
MKKFWKEVQYQLLKTLAPPLGFLYIYLVGRTSKTVEIGKEAHDALRQQYPHLIYAAWHEHILVHAWVFRQRGISVLISQSRDGEYISRTVRLLGFRASRGSSSRGAVRGIIKLVRILKDEGDVGLTADGPRGPARECKPGVITLAKRSGLPIIPIVASASRSTRVNSWDRMIVPYPFSTLTVMYGDPIFIPEDADKEALADYQQQVKQALDALTTRVESLDEQ